MAGMTNTKYGYFTPQEVKKDVRLDIWYRDKKRRENKRRKQHAKNKKMSLS
ncbi:hypothetical protein ACIPCB_01070 [Pediococcus pentosaceus]|uniref:Uncharacterized protein n=1 Tax=Pediococcus pentosaceus CGMCC 7049 TaxID=1460385 RepID=A0AAU7NIV8_PEDPE|nr:MULTISPECIES: hypothetical protein [Pediococcus]MCV3324963.1 hypothetical protein [Pediococcus pentosaceus]QIO85055.1 hypothetical protein HAQ15_03255 [Pediococcus acidilactici]QJW86547.1 hypothetical protein HN015_03260 [Pediococcus acidilactici]QYI95392.1 hypothetical protein K0H57_03240 [Pediococcus acidilactici]